MSPDPSFDVVPLTFSHGLASHPQRDSSYTAPNLAFQEDFRLRDLPDEVYEDLPDLGLLAMGWNLVPQHLSTLTLNRAPTFF